jgi:nitrate reductase assembly molybdenum cofactor insertion protein NarJ
MTTHASLDAHTIGLLRDAAAWRIIAKLFECPDDYWRDDLTRLAAELDAPDVRAAVDAIDEAATPAQYYSVFGPGGPAPPREASYHDSLELGSLMSDLAGYYEAFSYAPKTSEPLDHVAIEVGFVSYLKFKEAYARAQGDAERAEITARAITQFVADHLARIAEPIAKILAASHLVYLVHASRALTQRVGPRPPSARLPMLQTTSEDDDSGEIECGGS